MIMKKKFLYVMALAAMVSCSSDEFVGDSGSAGAVNGNGGEKAIQFTSNTPQVTRSTGAEAAAELGYSFSVYAIKNYEGASSETDDDDIPSNVFALNSYYSSPNTPATSNTPYQVWYTSTANTTTSNTYGWEYVGAQSSSTTPETTYGTEGYKVRLAQEQTIKYWDYSAKNYVFTAYKANKPDASSDPGTVSDVTTSGFTFTGTPAQFANLYVADKVTITEKSNPAAHTTADNKIGDVVQFTFRSAAAKVRLGIYETIPGYVVKNLNFRPNGDITGFTTPTSDATLSGKFMGNSTISSLSGENQTFTITYPLNVEISGLNASHYFNFGTFASSADAGIGITSTAPTWAGGSSYASANYYQIALPNINPINVDNMVLYVDYVLYNSVSGETINVTGAKAVVPAMYMTWKANYAYTYLFKISDNTSGTTGSEGTSPAGLFPITFDAVTVATTEGQDVGIISTVSIPTVTTYQTNSVVDIETTEPRVSEHGITYANANGPIYITVNTNGTLATLNASGTTVNLYTVDAGTTEADLLLNVDASSINKHPVESGVLIIPESGENETIQGITFTVGKYAKFTPTANTTYAFEYIKAPVGTPCVAATGTYVAGTKYYTTSTGTTEVDTTGFVDGVTDVSTYFVANPSYEPEEKAYKVIQVAAS